MPTRRKNGPSGAAANLIYLTLVGLLLFGLWAILYPESFKRLGLPAMIASPVPPIP